MKKSNDGLKKFELRNVVSPWNGRYYIGFVLDSVNEYLDLRVSEYQMDSGHLDKRKKGIIKNGAINICIWKVGETKYIISGFPGDRDFEQFRREIQNVWEGLLEKMISKT